VPRPGVTGSRIAPVCWHAVAFFEGGELVFTRRVEVFILRPLEEVFAFVDDARNRPRWDESVDSEELTSPEPIGVGTTVRTRMRSMGREYEYNWEIVEHDPPNRMTVESTSGSFPTTLGFQFKSQNDGTRVEASVTGRPTGLLRLLQPLIARTRQKNFDQGYARLKRLLETGNAA
jgi:carbon monoxide dehydrogenase subunit G